MKGFAANSKDERNRTRYWLTDAGKAELRKEDK
jgi:DNA-binding PadR family transcriptional regulator